MNRQKDRYVPKMDDDPASKKRRVNENDDFGRRAKQEVHRDAEEVQIVFAGSKGKSKRKDSTEELLRKANEKNESLELQLNEAQKREVELSRRLEEFELLSRV
ncbi:hypothetical protein PMAYCL1PPCAC_25914, partial [Pristionchus mayeri]